MAAALSLSEKITICVPLQEEYSATLKYKDTFFKGFDILNYIPDGIPVYEEPFYHYNSVPYTEGTDLIIKGYFQSHRYFDRSLVLKQYSIDDNTIFFIEKKYPEILKGGYTSIHIRRGDYLKMLYKHPFCGLKYYKKAIDLIGKNENFIIVSDDITWCKNNIKLKNVIFAENTSPIIDLYIQSYCENNILSNSSFSWWGAYLNKHINKKVIVPSLWFGYKANFSTKDLLPRDYIVIINKYSFVGYLKSVMQLVKNKIFFLLNNKDVQN
ncbi:alpha-1,2-fucosyltransferase [Pedobacter kyungheensis]|nr:alpha-1,2-fucosyltransferase [Pedobacter kyungheensis]